MIFLNFWISDVFQKFRNCKDHKTVIKVNNETFQTTNPKYFAGGDAINGGAEVVNAAYDGKMAVHGIHNWLSNKWKKWLIYL